MNHLNSKVLIILSMILAIVIPAISLFRRSKCIPKWFRLVIGICSGWIKKKKALTPQKYGTNIALSKLRLARNQISENNYREFANLLSSAVKFYIHKTYKIKAFEMTSEEIINYLLANPKLELSVVSLVTEVLRISDEVKFSQRRLSTMQQRGLYKKSCRFILFSQRLKRKSANGKFRKLI